LEEEPSTEDAPAAQPDNAIEPKEVVEPESAAAPEQAAPAAGVDGVEGLQHEVLPGQTLFQIAELYGLSVQEIAAANNLVNPTQLQPGMILIIPQSQ
jgi:LysM repeat protein